MQRDDGTRAFGQGGFYVNPCESATAQTGGRRTDRKIRRVAFPAQMGEKECLRRRIRLIKGTGHEIGALIIREMSEGLDPPYQRRRAAGPVQHPHVVVRLDDHHVRACKHGYGSPRRVSDVRRKNDLPGPLLSVMRDAVSATPPGRIVRDLKPRHAQIANVDHFPG